STADDGGGDSDQFPARADRRVGDVQPADHQDAYDSGQHGTGDVGGGDPAGDRDAGQPGRFLIAADRVDLASDIDPFHSEPGYLHIADEALRPIRFVVDIERAQVTED